MISCPRCKEQNEKSAERCHFCGYNLKKSMAYGQIGHQNNDMEPGKSDHSEDLDSGYLDFDTGSYPRYVDPEPAKELQEKTPVVTAVKEKYSGVGLFSAEQTEPVSEVLSHSEEVLDAEDQPASEPAEESAPVSNDDPECQDKKSSILERLNINVESILEDLDAKDFSEEIAFSTSSEEVSDQEVKPINMNISEMNCKCHYVDKNGDKVICKSCGSDRFDIQSEHSSASSGSSFTLLRCQACKKKKLVKL